MSSYTPVFTCSEKANPQTYKYDLNHHRWNGQLYLKIIYWLLREKKQTTAYFSSILEFILLNNKKKEGIATNMMCPTISYPCSLPNGNVALHSTTT
jgi:hypothetical protein